jgi:two-component system, LytTR family, sensor kinase
MKEFLKPSKLQLYSFIASMPIIDFVLNYIMYDERVFRDIKIWIVSYPLIFLIGIFSWWGHTIIGNWLKRTYSGLQQTGRRILFLALLLIPFMSASVLFIFLLYDKAAILGYKVEGNDLQVGLLVGFCVNLIFETLFEADYVLERYKQSVEEKNTIQKLAIQDEFDALKSQVKPHFLFNCFNTLSSLISEDKNRADHFLSELSKVYRYLLMKNEDGLSTVDSEIKFIHSYYQLLQTRHGEALKMQIEIDKRYHDYLLPSLSLQLLVENVVKHNVLYKNNPLMIEIFTTVGNKLVVNNNLQRRAVKAQSNKVGLENIKAKYALLKQPGFQVMEDERSFTVILPLIWNGSL